MKTSSWATIGATPGRIGISAGSPRGQAAGYRLYKALAPERAWMHSPLEQYRPLYEAKLAALDPQKVWDELHALAGGAEPILLCFEKPTFTRSNFCHRRLAALWMEGALGVKVEELGFEGRDIDFPGFRQTALAI